MSANEQVKIGFELEGKILKISAILPTRVAGDVAKKSTKYAAVLSSIREIGIIEPPVVYPMRGSSSGQYLMLDGHLRIEALKDLGQSKVYCLIATDDETYTYNHKVSRISPIQEHFMIMRALERGVNEERIARALQVDVGHIRRKRDLLRGICPEAVAILKNTAIGAETFRYLRKAKPARQVEIAELMNMVGNYSASYCQALIASSPKEQLIDATKPASKVPLTQEELSRMQVEMESLHRYMQEHADTYGQDLLQLVAVRGYLSKLLKNTSVLKYMSKQYPDILQGFEQIVQSASLEERADLTSME